VTWTDARTVPAIAAALARRAPPPIAAEPPAAPFPATPAAPVRSPPTDRVASAPVVEKVVFYKEDGVRHGNKPIAFVVERILANPPGMHRVFHGQTWTDAQALPEIQAELALRTPDPADHGEPPEDPADGR
jgi:hypothetical protein